MELPRYSYHELARGIPSLRQAVRSTREQLEELEAELKEHLERRAALNLSPETFVEDTELRPELIKAIVAEFGRGTTLRDLSVQSLLDLCKHNVSPVCLWDLRAALRFAGCPPKVPLTRSTPLLDLRQWLPDSFLTGCFTRSVSTLGELLDTQPWPLMQDLSKADQGQVHRVMTYARWEVDPNDPEPDGETL